jgi:hypothetical protein
MYKYRFKDRHIVINSNLYVPIPKNMSCASVVLRSNYDRLSIYVFIMTVLFSYRNANNDHGKIIVSMQMSFSKITQVFRRTVFPTHFVIRRVQCLQSPRSDLFQLPFSRTLTSWKHWKDLVQEVEVLKDKLQ